MLFSGNLRNLSSKISYFKNDPQNPKKKFSKSKKLTKKVLKLKEKNIYIYKEIMRRKSPENTAQSMGYLPIRTVNARDSSGTSRDKQGQVRDKHGKGRDKQGQAGTSRDKQGHSLYVPTCPCLSMLDPACPYLTLSVLVGPCMSLHLLYLHVYPCK